MLPVGLLAWCPRLWHEPEVAFAKGLGLEGSKHHPRGVREGQEPVPGVYCSSGCPHQRYPPLQEEFPLWIHDCHRFFPILASPKREAVSCPARRWWCGRVNPCQLPPLPAEVPCLQRIDRVPLRERFAFSLFRVREWGCVIFVSFCTTIFLPLGILIFHNLCQGNCYS